MDFRTRLLFSLFCCAAFSSPAQAPAAADSGYRAAAIAHTIAQYYRLAGDQASLYNGNLYANYPYVFASGTPFYRADTFRTGDLYYDGVRFEKLPLLYDALRDCLITIDQGYWLQLVREKLDWFNIEGERFIRVEVDSTAKNVLKTGFYRVLYTGKSQVLEKTVKGVREDIVDQKLTRNVETRINYYVQTGGADHRVGSLKDLLVVFAGKKGAMKAFQKRNRLRYRKHPEDTILAMTRYYDQLIQ